MSWGPVPSQLRLLSQLKDAPVGDKVRFLGCVTSYDSAAACLNLGHMYPPGTNETVRVNIELVLETIQSGVTQVGQWVNVVGYIVEGSESLVHVQALLLWPTGPLDIGRYEKSLQEQIAGS
ncbi:CST complex subunit Ten1 [Trichoderma compactum]